MENDRRSISARDIAIVGALLAVVCLFLVWNNKTKKTGTIATVTIIGQDTMYIPLDEDNVYHIDANLPVTLEVQDGAIRFANSVCPDHLCENTGFISQEGEQATCMPAGVSVIILDEE